ncbi:cupin domain-containing protein [Streptomyces sp. MB09-02B]|uniref:cupin domain-containing protein n=1 Tax=Streptomyces sp. MB09-02B TaxID=3028667 RepID=UPI0029A65609|nr:cupin domain-containing protein [Streptomyces sp. MB09-02B]MDX3638817.1 cupin domain-containing protein [Streptomyces sp. MB09-02B]
MPRRIVTGLAADGKAAVVQDGQPPRTNALQHTPGFVSSLVWATPAQPAVPFAGTDPTPAVTSYVPEPGATRVLHLVIPPDTVYRSEGFDPAAAVAERLRNSPGLAELFEPDAPGMHTTDTVDYGVLLEGEIVLELDAGNEVTLAPGDVVVQNGTRHAWRNRSTSPATMLFVLIGARRNS